MKTDTWVEEMYKQCAKEEKKETPEVKLSESDMNTLADIMIKKMSNESFDVEKEEKKEGDLNEEVEKEKNIEHGEVSLDD